MRERETEHEQGGAEKEGLLFNLFFEGAIETENERGRSREWEAENSKQAPGSELLAQSPTQGSNSQTERS